MDGGEGKRRQKEEKPDGRAESQDASERRREEDGGIKARDVEGE